MQFSSEPIVMLPVKCLYDSIAFRLGTHSFQQLSPRLNFSGITYSPPFHDLLGPLKELKKLLVLSSVHCPSFYLDKVKLYCSSKSFTSCPMVFLCSEDLSLLHINRFSQTWWLSCSFGLKNALYSPLCISKSHLNLKVWLLKPPGPPGLSLLSFLISLSSPDN